MRRAVLVLVSACGFHSTSAHPDGGDGSATASIVDDTAAEFAAGSADGAAIDPRGTVEPAAYVLGGWRASAYDGNQVGGKTSWAALQTALAAATARGIGFEALPTDWMNGRPNGLALTSSDNFTVVYDGELLVTAGDHMISLDADDDAAIEIAGAFTRVSLATKTVTFHADADGWVPVRMAIGDNGGSAKLVVKLDGQPLTAQQARVNITTEQGLQMWVYFNFIGSAGPAFAPSPNVNWGMTPPPFDFTGVPTGYTARFMGQLRIPHDGTYTLATTTGSTTDGSALYIDGHMVSRTNVLTDPHPASATLDLTAGWHSIVAELSGGQTNILGGSDPHNVTLATTIADGSGPAMPITADMLRPAVMTGAVANAFTPSTPLNDTDVNGGLTTIPVPVSTPAPPPGAVVDSAGVLYIYKDAAPSDYTVTLDERGTPLMIPSTSNFVYLVADETGAGKPVPTNAGDWTFTFVDTVPGNSTGKSDQSVLGLVGYTMHGGPKMPFAPTWTYVSAPHQLDGVTALGPITVSGALAGAMLAVSVRTAASADALATAPWVDVANRATPAVAAQPFVQYRLVVTGDGWQYPSIDKVELAYTRSP
ncbi:MAG: hypothetical protein JO257_12255 [Deltaproteobacteria bacterium]|nr:hypothetical protein [Deltaproteobacteria bacterium]